MAADWWCDNANLHMLGRWLVEEAVYGVDELLRVLEKPWNYDEEFERAARWAGVLAEQVGE